MKKLFNMNTLRRVKKVIMRKESILILAALGLVVIVAARGGGQPSVSDNTPSGIKGMTEDVGTVTPVSELPEAAPEYEPLLDEPPPDANDEPPIDEPTPYPESDLPEPLPDEPTADELPVEAIPPPVKPLPNSPAASTPAASTPPANTQPPEKPPESSPAPTATPSPTPGAPPLEATSEYPAQSALPQAPVVSFTYIWDGKEFRPCANITWQAESADSILWQLCDTNENVLSEDKLPANNGSIRLTDHTFNVTTPLRNGLYPKGYTLKLVPCYMSDENAESRCLTPAIMELPYFEVAAHNNGGQLVPVIATNIGLYFVHSHERLTISEEGGRLRVTGSLLPRSGTQVPLSIDVLSK